MQPSMIYLIREGGFLPGIVPGGPETAAGDMGARG